MRRLRLHCCSLLAVALVTAPSSFAAAPPVAGPGRPFATALTNAGPFSGNPQESKAAFRRARAAGAGAVRIYASWRDTVSSRPSPGFDPTNPGDPSYSWYYLDDQVRRAYASGLEPYLSIALAPDWAQGAGSGPVGTVAPDPVALGQFATAVARHFRGASRGVPRVRAYQVWNEPNASFFMTPQIQNGNLVAVARYRNMVNRVAAAVHGVDPTNRVVAGGLFPVELDGGVTAIGARRFMRALLCLGDGPDPKPVCSDKTEFDIWSVHPYTRGNAFGRAFEQTGAEMGDLADVKAILDAGVRTGQVRSRGPVPFWVTEFSWDSSPPDPKGVPVHLLTRWMSEALYQGWRSGVSLFTWFQLRDEPLSETKFQGGLYYACASGVACDQPKPTLQAFRFPFVAYRLARRPNKRKPAARRPPGKVYVWGRAPTPGTLTIEQQGKRGWRKLSKIRTDRYGVFERRVKTRSNGNFRARRAGGETAVSFSLTVPPDRPEIFPFGDP